MLDSQSVANHPNLETVCPIGNDKTKKGYLVDGARHLSGRPLKEERCGRNGVDEELIALLSVDNKSGSHF